ncbi:MAG TPA: hypothetical protein VFV76_09975, partial [Actinomycetes bacterium]|nr:hypothetical protein [Actinomycetes bacterium]
MTDPQLRTALHHLADEATVVDLRPGVRARTRVLRRRRRVAALAAPVATAVVAAALLTPPSEPESAPPADPTRTPTVDLAEAPTGGLDGARLVVTDSGSRATWLVTPSGQAARLPVQVDSLPGARPALSSEGRVLSFESAGTATLVRTADGDVTEMSIPGGQEHHVSVSPDGRTVAYASGNHADGIVLTLRPVDGTTPTTLTVPTSAAGALVPVVWSDDGSGLLVLDGKGATRVDLRPTPRVGQGVYVREDIVLANGWAAAPNLSRFVMSDSAPLEGGRRTWLVLDSGDGHLTEALTRPADDRLIGWTADDRLVWWRRTVGGYSVVTTDTAGQ